MGAVISELTEFRHFLDEQIELGRTDLTPEQMLQMWREARQNLPETIAAVRRALTEFDSGITGRSLREFAEEFRIQNQIPTDA
jgi:hypothetical protein